MHSASLLTSFQMALVLERDSSFASETIPALRYVQSSVKRSNSKFSKILEGFVVKRLNEALENSRLLCTMALDHRYAYIDKWITPKSWTLIELDLDNYVKEEPYSVSVSPRSSQDDDDIDDFLHSSLTSNESKTDKIQSELLRYKALLDTNRPNFENPLDFWRGNQQNFPKLARIAAELLGSPASSSASERLFSRCTDTLRQTKRNRAKLETLNEMLTIKELCRIENEEEGNSDETGDFNGESDEESSDEELEPEFDDAEINAQYPTDDVMPLLEAELPTTVTSDDDL
uniref:Dimer_Tnp_hAT domain-containing protein n=2 Tax=Caenorhabditis tropicalis TaxID=1561998 RepID=A0A1I7TTZ2_9PELO